MMADDFRVFRWRWLLVGLSALSFLVKILLVWLSQGINPDAVRYINAAHLFSQGEFAAGIATGGRTFLLPWLIQFVHHFLADWVLAGLLISAVAMSLALIPFFLVTRNIFGERAAIWVGIAFALSPVLNGYSVEIIRDPLFLLFFGWALWSMLCALDSPRPVYTMSALIFSALAFLCRIEAAVLVGFFVLILLLYSFRADINRGAYVKSLMLFFFSPLIVLGIIISITGSDVLSAIRLDEVMRYAFETFQFDFLSNYQMIYEKLKAFSVTLPFSQYAHNFGETALHFMPVIYLMGLLYGFVLVSYPLFFMLIFYGLLKKRAPSRKHVFCLSLAALYLMTAYVFLLKHNFISERYLLAPAMLLLPWLGAGAQNLIESVRRRPIFPAVVASLFLIIPTGAMVKKISQQEAITAQAGAWIREHLAAEGQPLLLNDERVALYAGLWRGEYATFGGHQLPDVEQLPQAGTAGWLVYQTSARKRAAVPELHQFQLVKEFEGKRKCVLIYRRI